MPRLSPDGRRVVYRGLFPSGTISLLHLSSGAATPLLARPGGVLFPIWRPGGREITFSWNTSGVMNLYQIHPDGGLVPQRLYTSVKDKFPGSWTPDGRTLAFVEGDDIFLLDSETGRASPFLNTPCREHYPEFSPDGRWLAYTSNESGREEVYVRSFPSSAGKVAISAEGGWQPLWARDGKRLFFRRGYDQFWAADVVKCGTSFEVERPRFLFGNPERLSEQANFQAGRLVRGYDISLDNQRFLMTRIGDRGILPTTDLILVQNWFEELKRLCPTK